MSIEELKPCPFCGGNPVTESMEHWGTDAPPDEGLCCFKCGQFYPDMSAEDWNTRFQTPLEAAAPELLEALVSLEPMFGDYISTMLAGRIPGWQNVDKVFTKARLAIAKAKGQSEPPSTE